MSAILGVVGAAVLFGLFTLLRARDRGGCTGGCAGCTGHGTCSTTDGETADPMADTTEGVKA